MVGSPSSATDPISRSCVTRIYALSRRGCFTNCSEQSARRKSTMPSSVLPSIFPISEICRSWKWRADSDQKFCNRAIRRIRNRLRSGRARSEVFANIYQPKANGMPKKSARRSILYLDTRSNAWSSTKTLILHRLNERDARSFLATALRGERADPIARIDYGDGRATIRDECTLQFIGNGPNVERVPRGHRQRVLLQLSVATAERACRFDRACCGAHSTQANYRNRQAQLGGTGRRVSLVPIALRLDLPRSGQCFRFHASREMARP